MVEHWTENPYEVVQFHFQIMILYTNYKYIKQLLLNKYPFNFKNSKFLIFPLFKNKKINIYNGIKYIPLKIKLNMSGYKIGSFFFTRQRFLFKKKKNLKK
jgi:ribosomal protein S19